MRRASPATRHQHGAAIILHETNPLLTLAVILAAGVAGGLAAGRLRLPSVTGQILIGIVIGPSLLGLVGKPQTQGLAPITDFALGLIAVAVGSHLNFRRLRNAGKRLALLLLFEVTLTPVLVFAAVYGISGAGVAGFALALLLAPMAVETAPATTLALVKETHSKGVFVKTLVAGVALNNMACLVLFEIAHTAAQLWLNPNSTTAGVRLALEPAKSVAVSALIGVTAALVLTGTTRRWLGADRRAAASLIAILGAAGLGEQLGGSALLACLFLGMTLANVAPDRDGLGHTVFGQLETAIFAVFFTLAGMKLNFDLIVPGGMLALGVFAARFVGKTGSAWLAMRIAGATDRVRAYLGLAMLPQAGVTVGLLLLVQREPQFAEIQDLVLAVGLTAVTLNELIGPILTRVALARSGDFGRDRARLIDFLHEENIITDLRADTKEEAIAQLTSLLVQSNHLASDRDALLQSVLDRENEVSTCIGGGLAIPHGVLDEQSKGMVGVMGISHEGLPFETPDGRPVHCMVLLATPAHERDRHLEVLAALARAIGKDPAIQQRLFSAKSPAHAYELLHTEEAEDFNYFLE